MNVRGAIFVVIDTETTGLDSAVDKLVEVAAVATTWQRVVAMWGTLVDPEMPIPAASMAVHGISDEQAAGGLERNDALTSLVRFERIVGSTVDVAHNRAFDAAFLDREKIPGLCTKRMAMHLWPDAPNHQLQTLRYWLKLEFDDYGVDAHRALGDTIVCAALFRRILDALDLNEIETVEQLQAFSDKPIRFTRWWFGPKYGEPLDSDLGLVKWALGKIPLGEKNMDADQHWSLTEVLKNA